MGVGGGITLIVLGLILMLGVIQADIPYLNEYMLGVILILGGIAVVALSLTLWRGPRRSSVVEREVVERDINDPRI